MNKEQAVEIVRARLKPKRLKHSLGVAETAEKLAVIWQVDRDKAFLAGILHDYAKNLDDETLLTVADNEGLIKAEWQRDIPEVLHAEVGAILLQKEQGFTDEAVLSAVKHHTLGAPGMNRLDEIILVADVIEPGRQDFPELEHIRQLAFSDIEAAVLASLNETLQYCLEQGFFIHPQTIATRNYYIKRLKKKGR